MAFGRSGEDSKTELDTKTGGATGTQRAVAFLGQGSKVVGTLTFSGAVELDGYVEGDLNAEKLTIGEQAVINARVTGAEIYIKGNVNGDIVASKRLVLQKPAKVVGNITSNNLCIEEGVIFEGQCNMTSPTSQQKGSPTRTVGDKVAATS